MLFFFKDTMTSRDLKGSVPFIVDEGGADDSELDHVYENATENTTENTIETMSPQTQQSTPRRVFNSPTKKKKKSSGQKICLTLTTNYSELRKKN